MPTDYETEFIQGYIECAIWSSTDDDGDPLDDTYSPEDISEEARLAMTADCLDFILSQRAELDSSGLSADRAGHDFWLTRNGHGAGFWDEGLGALGDSLTKATKPYGGSDLFVGNDGQLYVS